MEVQRRTKSLYKIEMEDKKKEEEAKKEEEMNEKEERTGARGCGG